MRKTKSKNTKILMLYQMLNTPSSCRLDYHLTTKDYGFGTFITDTIDIDCECKYSDYKGIKPGDIIEFSFHITDIEKDHKPTHWGSFGVVEKKLCCTLFVPQVFPNRLNFILNMGIKPYFYLDCEKLPYEKPIVKFFSMLSDVKLLEDYCDWIGKKMNF